MTDFAEATGADIAHPRTLGQRLWGHLAVVSWVAVLVLLLQVIPYPDIREAQRVNTAEMCLRDRHQPPGVCRLAEPVSLPAAVAGDENDVVTFSTTVQLDDQDAGQAILIPRAIDAVHVRVNGVDMTPTRSLDAPIWHDWNHPLYIGLPAPSLQTGANTIDIELRRENQGRLLLHPFYIGSADRLQMEWQIRFAFTAGASRMN
ncbi:hypothetical protein [Pararhodobacter sp. CCB-MM2]|uniref:hypothetical protein n=1 Tax=Pararhodobacter sp. CCB-MM2 TaxID=1786003 RepID=UPI000835217C|nr:hypothetical protein [Pararhodobacter sp. CCB-MM2]